MSTDSSQVGSNDSQHMWLGDSDAVDCLEHMMYIKLVKQMIQLVPHEQTLVPAIRRRRTTRQTAPSLLKTSIDISHKIHIIFLIPVKYVIRSCLLTKPMGKYRASILCSLVCVPFSWNVQVDNLSSVVLHIYPMKAKSY